ncbi:MAG: hydrogenase/urease maturation nickel metallochaperone HypA, partial [Candidatus Korarchaeota archaeon]|nr:hydrogenase/urease maturation nickel metallochaperone HypA [Candidatus Korarchaeota archaeon]
SRVKRIVIGLGELQNVEREVFEHALRSLVESNGLVVESAEIRVLRASFRCRRCGGTWSLDQLGLSEEIREAIHFLPEAIYAFVSCPHCGSRDYDITGGRGVTIEELEVE